MADLRLIDIATPTAVTFDLLQTKTGLIDETSDLATAIIVALATDGRANDDDVLPDIDSDDRRGWWGDQDAESIWAGWPIGSRLWLLERAKITGSGASNGATLTRIENYIREAIRPFITNKVASRFDVKVERFGLDRIGATITLYRGPRPTIELRFQSLWSDIKAG
jgi:phage gp46-like protein